MLGPRPKGGRAGLDDRVGHVLVASGVAEAGEGEHPDAGAEQADEVAVREGQLDDRVGQVLVASSGGQFWWPVLVTSSGAQSLLRAEKFHSREPESLCGDWAHDHMEGLGEDGGTELHSEP